VSFIDFLLTSHKKCLLLTLCVVLGACSSIADKSEFINQNEVNKNRLVIVKGNVDVANIDKNSTTNINTNNLSPEKPATVIPLGSKRDYDAALVFIDNKDWSNAIAQLQTIVVKYPELQGAGVALAWAHWQSGDKATAALKLQSLIDTNKLTRADAYNYLAIINREQGQFANAESLYKKAINKWPDDPVLHENLGVLYELYLGRLDDALLAYRQAQEIKGGADKKLKGWIKVLARKIS
jgi:tetratricopeptide (TPR) repeat protein